MSGPGTVDVPRQPTWEEPARRLARQAARAALAVTWRSLAPEGREPFAVPPAGYPWRLDRVYYEADDGWRAPLFRLDPRPGGAGEPVVLAHGLGWNHHILDYRADLSLARTLSVQGFTVYLLEHRGDRSALPPAEGERPFDFDDIATRDLPAALETIRDQTGFPRCHWVGHGFGGQLLYAWLAHARGEDVASAVTLCAPVRFRRATSTPLALEALRFLMPAGLRLPTRAVAALLAPTATEGRSLLDQLGAHSVPGEVLRGLMLHGAEDLHLGLVRQFLRWQLSGALTDRTGRLDYVEALHGLATPLLAIATRGDPHCTVDQVRPVTDALGAGATLAELDSSWGHLDPVLSQRAAREVFPSVVAWLDRHRRLAWEDDLRPTGVPTRGSRD